MDFLINQITSVVPGSFSTDITFQFYLGIREDVLGQLAFPLDHPVFEVAFGTNDEERVEHVDTVQSPEVVVASVEDVERFQLVVHYIHHLHVMNCRRRDMDENWNLSLVGFQIGQLTEHQDEELVPACEVLDVFVAIILADVIVEQTSVKERGEWRENVFVFVHLMRVFGKDKFKSVLLQNLRN